MDNRVSLEKNVEHQEQPKPSIAADMKFCKHCGGKIHKEAILCTLCGRQVEKLNENIQPQIIINNDNNNSNVNTNTVGGAGFGNPKNKWVALILAFFLGGLGAHKFYEGKTGLGILYILFVWTGIPSFVAFIEAIIILFKPNPYYVK